MQNSSISLAGIGILLAAALTCAAVPLIIDHRDIDITQLTEGEINRSKEILHIAYGHTSHGSQITEGMNGLVDFANGGGLGLSLPTDIFDWNNGGTNGALDLHDYAMGGDVGYYPAWYNNTVTYLDNPANSNVNVIMWSWCGQMSGKYSGGTLTNEYLAPMETLEAAYPDVTFVYMTGHVDLWNDANQKAACEAIRNYCIENNKVLFDFSDIEHYNPDGTYFEFVSDSCNYYVYAGGSALGNWASEWQDSHTEDIDWYSCGSAHSLPLNANMKAYAIWKLWCSLANDMDRDTFPDEWEEQYGGESQFGSTTNDCDNDGLTDWEEYIADTNPTNKHSGLQINSMATTATCELTFACSSARVYCLEHTSSLVTGSWKKVSGQTDLYGEADGSMTLSLPDPDEQNYYRIGVKLP